MPTCANSIPRNDIVTEPFLLILCISNISECKVSQINKQYANKMKTFWVINNVATKSKIIEIHNLLNCFLILTALSFFHRKNGAMAMTITAGTIIGTNTASK